MAEDFEQFARFALEERAGLVHAGAVGVGGDGVGKAVEFLAHVVVELLGAVGEFLWRGVAEEDAKLAAHLGEGFAEQAATGEGVEIAGAIFFFKTCGTETGEFFAEIDADEEEDLGLDLTPRTLKSAINSMRARILGCHVMARDGVKYGETRFFKFLALPT